MLTHLHIENYALIRHLDIDFRAGFSVITGQTGAGKSILLGALGLLQGNRADAKSIKAGAMKCIIEADFQLSSPAITELMETEELDFDGQSVTLRREITAAGKTRAFVNDTPVALTTLKALAPLLIDIHSQHQNLLLQQSDFQLSVLDSLHTEAALLAEYKDTFVQWGKAKRRLEETLEAQRNSQSDHDYVTFQYDQLCDAKLMPGEQEQLEQEQQTLEHAEDIKSALYEASGIIAADERGTIDQLRRAQRQLDQLSRIFPPAEELAARLDSCYIELRDINDTLEDHLADVEFEPGRLEEVNDRLSLIYELEQKHHVQTVDELIAIRESLAAKLQLAENHDQLIQDLQQEISRQEGRLAKQAAALTAARTAAAARLEQQMVDLLRPMGMPNIRFRADIQPADEFQPTGLDRVQFLFSANQGSPLQPIRQIASGGEIARVMLAIKGILSQHTHMPTIIFDEIDTGVSGSIAECMARTMQQMSALPHRQVISITHLPQIAALGTQHYLVYKEDADDSTLSHIRQLTPDERVEELAHMLSGAVITEAALSNARELLNSSHA